MFLKKNDIFPVASYLIMIGLIIFIVIILKDAFIPIMKTKPMETVDTGVVVVPDDWKISEQTGILRVEDVPFTPQAPFMNWGDIIYEEWCEEASMLMAVYWSRNKPLTSEIANEEIKRISDFEMKNFWASHDTSLHDTAKIMQEYFSFRRYELLEDIVKSDIVESLQDDNVVLVPLFGRELGNKYYTPPGPIPHMLVITGYDPLTKEFITNDPGTKYGEWYRYGEDVLFDAIWIYPTTQSGSTPPALGQKREKSMIVVKKE